MPDSKLIPYKDLMQFGDLRSRIGSAFRMQYLLMINE